VLIRDVGGSNGQLNMLGDAHDVVVVDYVRNKNDF